MFGYDYSAPGGGALTKVFRPLRGGWGRLSMYLGQGSGLDGQWEWERCPRQRDRLKQGYER